MQAVKIPAGHRVRLPIVEMQDEPGLQVCDIGSGLLGRRS